MSSYALVIEEDAVTRRVLADALRSNGCEIVVEAKNGGEGLKCFHAGRFDVVALSGSLTSIQSDDVLQRIHHSDASAAVVWVGAPTDDAKQDAIDEMIAARLQTPVSPTKAETVLRTVFARAKANEPAPATSTTSENQALQQCLTFVNAFVVSVVETFRSFVGWQLRRGCLEIRENYQPTYEVSSIIQLAGAVDGTLVISLERCTALHVATVLLEERQTQINATVRDAVGELTNIVAGGAKARFGTNIVELGLPEAIIGRNHVLPFRSGVRPILIPFDSQHGSVALQFWVEPARAKNEDQEAETGESMPSDAQDTATAESDDHEVSASATSAIASEPSEACETAVMG